MPQPSYSFILSLLKTSGDCTIKNYDEKARADKTKSQNGDIVIDFTSDNIEVPVNNGNQVDKLTLISRLARIAGMDGNQNELSIKDLAQIKEYFQQFKANSGKFFRSLLLKDVSAYKYISNLKDVRFDPNAGVATIVYDDDTAVRIDFETENEENGIKGGFKELKDAVGMRESSDDYTRVNDFGYMGRYQFGHLALTDLKYFKDGKFTGKNGINSKNDFLNNAKVQDEAFEDWLPKLWGYLKKIEIKQSDGTKVYVDATKFLNNDGFVIVNGKKITASGLILGAHLKGAKAVYDYLQSGGKENAKDGLGTSVEEYLTLFSGYKLDFI